MKKKTDEQWAPVSDLMAVLMLIFMFISLLTVRHVLDEREINELECNKIYDSLMAEFDQDFEKWDIALLDDLTIRFNNPELLFKPNESRVSPRFETILQDFFPRYLEVILQDKYRSDIRKIRIEGHTSSEWKDAVHEKDAYFLNMQLSQARTWNILRYIMTLPTSVYYFDWAKKYVSADGMSSSDPILTSDGIEDKERSRRVDFRLITTSCRRAGVYEQSI
ncbi:MAG: OmpA family protein [Gammaproteobacteria bacterium]|nr:OmpA family protein [Gammaproteobacteria bacterium]